MPDHYWSPLRWAITIGWVSLEWTTLALAVDREYLLDSDGLLAMYDIGPRKYYPEPLAIQYVVHP